MGYQDIILDIDNKHFLKIVIPDVENNYFDCDNARLFYCSDKKEIEMLQDCSLNQLRNLIEALKDAINNKRILLENTKYDIGFLWNECLQGKEVRPLAEDSDGNIDWAGVKYAWWGGAGIQPWIYNKHGEIMIEVTPTYKWHFSDDISDPNYITYDKFIENYKPIFVSTLSKAKAKEWIKKAEDALELVRKEFDKFGPPSYAVSK